MSHSLLSPSKAHRFLACPASLLAEDGYPETTSKYADEGVKAHEYAAKRLDGGRDLIVPIADLEMESAVNTYCEAIWAMTEGAELFLVEQKLDTSGVYGYPDQSGTGDCIAVVDKELQVHDLKYGRGVAVYAPENWQLIIYGLAALELTELMIDGEIEQVRLVIHQPRLGSVSEAVYTIAEMMEYKKELQERTQLAIELYTGKDCQPGHYNPGEKQCKFCRHKANCEVFQNYCLSLLDDGFKDLTTAEELKKGLKAVDGKLLPVERLSIIMQNAELISDLLSTVQKRVAELLHGGEDVPGFKLVLGKMGNRSWEDEAKAEEKLKSMRLKQGEMYKKKIISPTDAEKLLKERPRAWNDLQAFITRAEGKPVVAPVSDKREAISMKPVAEEFEDLTPADTSADDLF
jgi:hypothetical protein